jgi:large subunit ribosomal protein L27
MAHTKSGGSTKLGRESRSKRLGVKINHGQTAKAGQIIIRQRGTKYLPGKFVRRGSDDTLYAAVTGVVQYKMKKNTNFDGNQKYSTMITVEK